MTTAIDTSVLLDLLIKDSPFGSVSIEALRKAGQQGRLIVCETVVAEIWPSLGSKEVVADFLVSLNLDFVPSNLDVGQLAGAAYSQYLGNRGKAQRVLPDFLVAAHARCFADTLLARDRGFYRDYFSELIVVDPQHP